MKPIEFLGLTGSPYSMKMLAYLRYRQIPHQMLQGSFEGPEGYPQAKIPMLPTFYLPDESGEIQAVIDSTPLIKRFEKTYDNNKAIPDDGVLRFLVDLVEDYADEWLAKIMFHYRWAIAENVEHITPKLIYWAAPNLPAQQAEQMGNFFAQRQISRLKYVGSNEITGETIEQSYIRLIDILDKLIQQQAYLFGSRPSSADFALYGQLFQIAKIDLTSSNTCQQKSPRLSCWIDLIANNSLNAELDKTWLNTKTLAERLRPLLCEIGCTYAPLAVANLAAITQGNKQVSLTINDTPWQQDAFPYQAKCLQTLRQSFNELSPSEQNHVMEILTDTGCEVFAKA